MVWSLDGKFIFSANSQGDIEKLLMSKERSQTISIPESLENFKGTLFYLILFYFIFINTLHSYITSLFILFCFYN